MLQTGTYLADRYEILQQIGSGGMAYVYRAKDHKLNRYVAIKVLKEEFCRDKQFVQKFRQEAQAAAGLSHANIVGVYDVGETNAVYFIVMELIEGITLKDYIYRKHKLEIKESIGVAIQVAQGLEAAHSRHLIHRDIKPQNIIISRDGKIKVTDFGIARAITDETTNMYKAAGSVHYISPEQARGGYCDERSDIYSLGITMYEMVTGRVPFDGETTMAVAIAHMNEAIIPPSQIDSRIPLAVDQIIVKCIQKRPERRYSSCGELIADLRQAIVTPDEGFVTFLSDEEPGKKTLVMSEEDVDKIRSQENGKVSRDTINTMPINPRPSDSFSGDYPDEEIDFSKPGSKEDKKKKSKKAAGKTTPPTAAADETAAVRGRQELQMSDRKEEEEDDREEEYYGRKGSSAPASGLDYFLIILGGALSIVILLMLLYIVLVYTGHMKPLSSKVSNSAVTTTAAIQTEETTQKESDTEKIAAPETSAEAEAEGIPVPSVIGYTVSKAQQVLADAGLGCQISSKYVYSDDYGAGYVCNQNIPADEKVPENTIVTIAVSLGSDKFQLDGTKYIGTNKSTLEYALKSYDQINVTYVEIESETTSKGTILKLEPESATLAPGDSLTVYYSHGPTKLDMVSLIGYSREQAASKINNLGLELGSVTEAYSETVDAGAVCDQSIAIGQTIPLGSTVDIVISLGMPSVQVPYVIGMSNEQAIETLKNAGLAYTIVYGDSSAAQDTVINQDLQSGNWVLKWSTVTLTLSNGPNAVSLEQYTLSGWSQEETVAFLQNNGLVIAGFQQESNPWVAQGLVIRLILPRYTGIVYKGEAVTIVVSSGP